jgi:outer membrane biosynthesis protein TonB
MDQAPQLDFPGRPPFGSRRGIVMGIAVSVLLHLLLILGYRISVPPAPPLPAPAEAMTVWLRPAPPPVPVPPVKPKEAPPPKPVAKVEPPRKKPRKEEELAAKPSSPAPAAPAQAAVPPQPITVPPAGQQADLLHPELAPKKFDMEAALKTARKVASERDPARANLPVGQLDTHPLYPEETDTKLARDIKSAKRPDCKDSSQGGLLAPLFWMMDKKDSGCKW